MLVLATATPAQAPTGSGAADIARQAGTVSWYEHRHNAPGTADAAVTGYGAPAR